MNHKYPNSKILVETDWLLNNLSKPDLIIFDEATNALDINTEVEIYSSIIKELSDKTLIVVDH